MEKRRRLSLLRNALTQAVFGSAVAHEASVVQSALNEYLRLQGFQQDELFADLHSVRMVLNAVIARKGYGLSIASSFPRDGPIRTCHWNVDLPLLRTLLGLPIPQNQIN